MRIAKLVVGITGFLLCSVVVFVMFFRKLPWPNELRDVYESSTVRETGATNIVSAIYLGYRAYDTLGETIVLYISVAGTLYLIKISGQGFSTLANGNYDNARRRRTGIIRVITAKLGPAILIFGIYVMAFGYRSPGGGFQGGAVVASGIVILAVGYIENLSLSALRMERLKKLEKALFAVLVLCFSLGLLMGTGFLANPLAGISALPVIYISILNLVIGLKVGASVGLLCIAMLVEDSHE